MKKFYIILAVTTLVSCTMYAQNDDQFLPSELKHLTAVTEPTTLNKGFFRIGTLWSYTGYNSLFGEDVKRSFIPGSSINRAQSFDFSFQYGISDRFQFNLVVPYHLDKSVNILLYDLPSFHFVDLEDYEILQKNYSERGFGFGDLSAGLFTQLVKESDLLPSITIRTTAVFPTGRKDPGNFSLDSLQYDSPTGIGEFKLAVDVLARKIVYPYSFSFYSGMVYGFGGQKVHFPDVTSLPFQSGIAFLAAGSVNFHLNDWICLTNELKYDHIGKAMYNNVTLDNTKWRFMYTPSLHFQVKKLRLVQGVSIPLIGKTISADPLYNLIVQFIF